MKILGYVKEKETLYIQFDTKYVWNYKPVTQEMYNELLATKEKERLFISMVRNSFLIGTLKEVNNEFNNR